MLMDGAISGMATSPSGKRTAIQFVPFVQDAGKLTAGDSRWRVYLQKPPYNWIMSHGRFYRDIEAIIEDFDQRGWQLTRDE